MSPALLFILLGIVLAGYWGRVLRMAYKARHRTGRAANLVPGEKLGRLLRIIWTPAIIIWVISPFLTVFWRNPWAMFRPLAFNPWIAWPALVVAGGCLAASRLCWRTMGRHWRMGIDPADQTPLIASGPFTYVRHPIYALSMTMMLATVAILPSPAMLGAAILHIGLLAWESRREERHLLRLHGEKYSVYRRQVGAFFPRTFS